MNTDLTKDPDYIAYQRMLEQGQLDKYRGKHVAFVGGELVDNDLDEGVLARRVRELYADKSRFFMRVLNEGESEEVHTLPFSVRYWYGDVLNQ